MLARLLDYLVGVLVGFTIAVNGPRFVGPGPLAPNVAVLLAALVIGGVWIGASTMLSSRRRHVPAEPTYDQSFDEHHERELRGHSPSRGTLGVPPARRRP